MLKSLLGPIVKSVLGPLIAKIPDENERRRLEAQAEENLLTAITGLIHEQIKVNLKEAEHPSLFVAGWRPAVGWTCTAGLAWNYIVSPLLSWVLFINGSQIEGAPTLDIGQLMVLLTGMLGLGGFRTYEKRTGVARTQWKDPKPGAG